MIYRAKLYSVLFLLTIVLSTRLYSADDSRIKIMAPDKPLTEDIDTSFLEKVFDTAPQDAKNIVAHLEDPNFLNDKRYRYAIFVGASGTGKTETASAIAYKMYKKGWIAVHVPASVILNGQEEMDKRLDDALDKMAKKEEVRMIIIVDEFDKLFDKFAAFHKNDNAQDFWQFMTKADRPECFIIGTMNSEAKLPRSIDSEIWTKKIDFKAPTDHVKRDAFLDSLIKDDHNVKFESNINDVDLDQILQMCESCSFYVLQGLAFKTKQVCRRYNSSGKNIVIARNHMDQAIAETMREKEKLNL